MRYKFSGEKQKNWMTRLDVDINITITLEADITNSADKDGLGRWRGDSAVHEEIKWPLII